jgi:outer membrane protein TolC
LLAEQCQCLAAANSSLGNLLAAESGGATAADMDRLGMAADASTRRNVLACRSVEERNRCAAAALRLFYLLAEAEANCDLLRQTIQETDHAIDYLRRLKERGLQVHMDDGPLQRQRLDLLDQWTQLEVSLRQMTAQLRALLGWDAGHQTPIWPAADLAVTAVPILAEAAVRDGLATRADLTAFRVLRAALDMDTLPAARSGISRLDALLGGSAGARRLLAARSGSLADYAELQTRQTQLNQIVADRERSATEEILQAVRVVDLRLRQIALAQQKRDLWQRQLDRLREKRAADGVTAFDISTAQVELLRAESDLLHKVIAWRTAQVDLKEAQGLLAAECGYCLPGAGQCP